MKKLSRLLNNDGQVLLIIRHIRKLKYWNFVYTPQYNGRIGIPIKFIFWNVKYFKKFVLKYGFKATILGKEGSPSFLFYLVRLIKNPSTV